MTRGRFYVFSIGNHITPVEGWKCTVYAQNGNSIDIGMYRPKYARYWNVVEQSSGLSICTGGTKNEAISNAMNLADAVENLLTEADNNPESAIRKARDRMSAYVKKDAEEPVIIVTANEVVE